MATMLNKELEEKYIELLVPAFKEILTQATYIGALVTVLNGGNIDDYLTTVENRLKSNELLK